MTLKDVALKANCSVATVSKALKNSSEISDEVKQRILAIAKECGYFAKASTRKVVLGGLKTVIFNDIKGDSMHLFADIQKLAKKYGLILLYVSVSEKDSLELLNQLGAYGVILKGAKSNSYDERVFALKNSSQEAVDFLMEISAYMPKRPSRAGGTQNKKIKNKTSNAKTKAETPNQNDKTEPASDNKEEIWLL